MRQVTIGSRTLPASLAARAMDLCGHLTRPLGYRGFYTAARALGRVVPRETRAVVQLDDDCVFEFFLGDPYWNRLVHGGFDYEPELHHVFMRLADLHYLFVDGGANFGYWSVLLSGKRFGCQRVVAIESVEQNFRRLRANCELNGGRFSVERAAIAQVDDEEVTIRYSPAETLSRPGASIVKSPGNDAGWCEEQVPTITIDTLVSRHGKPGQAVVAKLDVEGAEAAALEGMRRTLGQEVLVIYEDHGKDEAAAVTECVLGLGLHVWFVSDSGSVVGVKTIADARRVKVQRFRGYNFVAASPDSSFSSLFSDSPLAQSRRTS